MSISKNYETFVNAQLLLIYSARSWEDFTYREELEVIKTKLNLQIIYVPRHGDENWTGETGYVDKDLLERYIPIHRGSRQYFICAAPVMMDAVEAGLLSLDVPVTNIHMEHFNLA